MSDIVTSISFRKHKKISHEAGYPAGEGITLQLPCSGSNWKGPWVTWEASRCVVFRLCTFSKLYTEGFCTILEIHKIKSKNKQKTPL